MEHRVDAGLLGRRVACHLVGVGGNGAQMAACLAKLDIAMRALGHPFGLHVMAFDADRGEAYPMRYEDYVSSRRISGGADILISCMDSRSARRYLHQIVFRDHDQCRYWLDLGNAEATAQVVLGQTNNHVALSGSDSPRMPCVIELFPELLEESVTDDNRTSCSVRMSLSAQGLFIKDVAARFGAQLLYELFSKGRLDQHGAVINLDSKRVGPIEVDPRTWERFGYQVEPESEAQS